MVTRLGVDILNVKNMTSESHDPAYTPEFPLQAWGSLMKSLLAVALLVLPLAVHSEVTSETFCFSFGGGAKAINFEMRTYYDSAAKFSFGFVKYQHSKHSIPLVLISSADETLDKNVPDQETTTWAEVVSGQVGGEYEMTTQGTEISSMVYTSKKNQKVGFASNPNAIAEGGCTW